METLQELILSGRIVDVMLAFVALEIIVVLVIRYRRGGAVPPLPLLVNIGAGGSLMLALRVSLSGGGMARGNPAYSLHRGDGAGVRRDPGSVHCPA